MMGRSPTFLPTDRMYATNHMWALPVDGRFRLGLSAYAVKLLGDLSDLDWSIEPGATIGKGQPIGSIEGSKATSELYSPLDGRVEQINPAAVDDPSLINSNLYDTGWLWTIDGPGDSLLSPETYYAHLEVSWPLAERMLKKQAGDSHGR
jgi:glycine cleavage system H protein